MSTDRFGSASPRRTSLLAIIGLILAVGAFFLPAVGAIVLGAAAVVLGVLARRKLKQDPSTGPSWVSLTAIVIGAFVALSQAVLLGAFLFRR
ncbi:hypothetical protein [Agromyces sp. Marseille-P2726]|uniref:hypothetical protein n=1 Tax=Agromyces sp. Marseille-P2726 TaxID=2709132 RepID=UPI00156F6D8D|nr:hypothetical protein [Agromyces sp. Marseille-P2726]